MSGNPFNAGLKACINNIANHSKATHLVRAPDGRAKAKGEKQVPAIAAPLVHTNASQTKHYQPEKDMLAPPARRGADDALRVPSRMGDKLFYRDGRVEDL